jgi:peptidoglycan hydrolase CwlO-like protein
MYSLQVMKNMGDPKLIVQYVSELEEEIERTKKEIVYLKSKIDEKSAEIQYLQSVTRNGGY